ncbi:MAG TPA: flagellar biosynthetic protein FliR [Candidatus Acidoferrales bacterium]|nr:flagellar biosynthetic protein FliR [Candidatus Acidoferrales bacterium]
MNLFGLHTAELETLFLVWIRCSTIIMIMPIFGTTQIPAMARVGLGLLISFVVYPTVHVIQPLNDLGLLAVAILSQAIIGILFGFVTQMVFMGVQFAGEIIDIQIGFAVASVINPASQQQVTIIGELQLAIATLIFLVTDSHMLFFQGMRGSFNMLPLPWATLTMATQNGVITFFTQALLIVFSVSAPVAITLFLVNIALAFLARVAPQMNIFVIGFPLQITVGLIMLIITLPLLGYALPNLFAQVPRQLDSLMRSMAT